MTGKRKGERVIADKRKGVMKKGNVKIRMKQRGTMVGMIIAKGCDKLLALERLKEGDKSLLYMMSRMYGYRHHKLWINKL